MVHQDKQDHPNREEKEMVRASTGTNGRVDLDAAAMTMLAQLAGAVGGQGSPMVEGEGVKFHKEPYILVPEGIGYERARQMITRAEKEAETRTEWIKWYEYRFNDGAHALMKVLKARYGGAFGEATMGMFGPEPPRLISIPVAFGKTEQVPSGALSLPALPGLEFNSHRARNANGEVFVITAEGPRKYAAEVEALFSAVEEFLREHSIYRGAAVVGATALDFLDLSKIRRHEIVFASDALELLDTTVWGPIRNARWFREEGIPLKRAALLSGPYGTGKTSAGLITALEAVQAGWTYLSVRPGQDDVMDALVTARLYAPCVVFLEDIDVLASNGEDDKVSKFLEAFDGVAAKGSEIVVVMTTNHLEKIHKGMLRPGRVDAIIPIDSLDRDGIERLIKAVVPADKRLSSVDYDEVAAAMVGFYPAFVKEAIDRARAVAITTRRGRDYALDTEAFVVAARSLRAQLDALEDAGEGARRPTLDVALATAVRGAVVGLGFNDDDGDTRFGLGEPSEGWNSDN